MRTLVGSVVGLFLTAGWLSAAEAVDYAKDVKPILAKKCISCHGQGKAKGKFRVDTLANMFKGGSSGPGVVPGKPDDSTLVQSLTGDGIKRMPPKRPLSKAEIDTITKWVASGAKAVKDEPAGRKPAEGRRVRERENQRDDDRKKGDDDDDDDKKDDRKKAGNRKKGERKQEKDDD
jgi:mono/diheme cytochrome c family protein